MITSAPPSAAVPWRRLSRVTGIAFTAWGEGEPLIIIDGATAYPAINPTNEEIGRLLSDTFRTYAYDRRGRGQSTDTAPYAVEREIEDLAALIEVAGAPATVFGWSSGAVLALDAAVAGLPITRLALFEPPFVVDNSRPPLPVDYVERLDAAVADGRPGDAAELFLTAAAGMPQEVVAGVRQSEFWPVIEAVAPTIAYDGRIMGTTMSGAPLPRDRWAAVAVPTLVLYGTGTFRSSSRPPRRSPNCCRPRPCKPSRASSTAPPLTCSRPRCATSPSGAGDAMGRIVVTEFISLDGVAEAPGSDDFKYANWSFEFDRGEEGEQFRTDGALGAEAQLLGRRTCDGFAAAWPQYEGGLADKYNGMPKYVVLWKLTESITAGEGVLIAVLQRVR
jgi:pimeloyl-ACP methyl ester carboxylesterase